MGIVGVGVLLEEVLRRKVFAKKDKHYRVITDEKYEEMHKHFMKIATSPHKCKPVDFKKYTLRDLADYMFEELLKWFQYMEKYHQIDEDENYVTRNRCDGKDEYAQSFVATWNENLPKLVCIHLAKISVRARLNEVKDETLQNYLTCIRQKETETELQTQSKETKTWMISRQQLNKLGVTNNDAQVLETRIEKDNSGMTEVINRAVLAYVTDWEANRDESQLAKVQKETLLRAEKQLKTVTAYVKSDDYKVFRDDLTITT